MTTKRLESANTPLPPPQEAMFDLPNQAASALQAQAAADRAAGAGHVETPVENEDDTPPPAKKPYDGLARDVSTPEELHEYAKDLEKKAVQATLAAERSPQSTLANNQPAPQTAGGKVATDEELEDLMYTNPKAYHQKMEERVMAKINVENQRKEATSRFWSGFYDENRDLQNADMVVQSVLREKEAEIAHLPLAEAKRILAAESRRVVAKIRGTDGTTTELSRTAAGTLPSSGGTLPKSKVVQEEPESFTQQIRKLQKRRA